MKKICKQCGAEFEVRRRHGHEQFFCSQKCKSKWQYENSDEERVCVICGRTFIINKYKHTRTCSRACGAILREQFSFKKMVCENCGREYEGHYKNRNRFCCRKCKEEYVIKMRHEKRNAAEKNSIEGNPSDT